MRVLMIDDHVMFLQGLKHLLGLLVTGLDVDITSSIAGAIELAEGCRYDLVLLDWHLEDCTGPLAIDRLRDVGCAARIIVLSGDIEPSTVAAAMTLGAAGFVPKRYGSDVMVSALDIVLRGGIFLPPEFQAAARGGNGANLVEAESRLGDLTPRQLDVYRAVARGLPNKLIARELGIAESTVKSHVQAVFAELGLNTRAAVAYHASREGIRVG